MIAANKIHPARRSRPKSARRFTTKLVPVRMRKSMSGSYADTQIATAQAIALVMDHARRRHAMRDSRIALPAGQGAAGSSLPAVGFAEESSPSQFKPFGKQRA